MLILIPYFYKSGDPFLVYILCHFLYRIKYCHYSTQLLYVQCYSLGEKLKLNLSYLALVYLLICKVCQTLNCLMLGVCIILNSEKAGMRCLNEKMKDCYLNQT